MALEAAITQALRSGDRVSPRLSSPVTIPYRRYSTNTAHWWVGRAVREVVQRAGLAQHRHRRPVAVELHRRRPTPRSASPSISGLSPRWLDHVPLGGASGIVALRRAARAVQCGDAEFVVCVAGDTNQVDSFRAHAVDLLALRPGCRLSLRLGRPQCQLRPDRPQLHEALRRHARGFRQDLRRPARQRAVLPACPDEEAADPRRVHVGARRSPIPSTCSTASCPAPAPRPSWSAARTWRTALGLPAARLLATIERHNAFPDDPIQYRGGWAMDVAELYAMAGVTTGRRRLRRRPTTTTR